MRRRRAVGALCSLIEINYFFTLYFSLMGFFRVCWRRPRPVGLPALYWNFLPLPSGAATRKQGSSTVRCSWLCCEVLSSKIWAFGGCYGAVRDAESDVGAALRRDGGAASYEDTGA